MTSGVDIIRQILSRSQTRSMARPRVLTASYRPLVLMSASMPDRRRVSLAPVNTLAPSGIRSLMRVRAAVASSRISTVKPCAVSAAAARSRRGAGAGSANSAAGIGVVMMPPGLVVVWRVLGRRRVPGRRAGEFPRRAGRRAGQRRGVEVPEFGDAFGELPAVRGALVAVVVNEVVQMRAAVACAGEFAQIGAAGCGVAVELDRARVGGLHEVIRESLPPLAEGANLLRAGGLDGALGDPHYAVAGEQRREAVMVVHHHRVGELAAQRLDLDAVSDGLRVAHWFPAFQPSSVLRGSRARSDTGPRWPSLSGLTTA